jgi:hypothetical protein
LNQRATPLVLPTAVATAPAVGVKPIGSAMHAGPSVSSYLGPRFRTGDRYTLAQKDPLSCVILRQETCEVTGVTGLSVERDITEAVFVRDAMGGRVRDDYAVYDPPLVDLPSEYALGKRWRSRSRITRFTGSPGYVDVESRIVRRETVVIGSTGFEAYVIETSGFQFTDIAVPVEAQVWAIPEFGVPLRLRGRTSRTMAAFAIGAPGNRNELYEVTELAVLR